MTSKLLVSLFVSALIFAGCSTSSIQRGTASDDAAPEDSQQTSSPRSVSVKICPKATFGPLAYLISVPGDLHPVGLLAMGVSNPDLSVQGNDVMWGNTLLGSGSLSAPDLNKCVGGKITLADNVHVDFSQQIHHKHKMLCTDQGGVMPSPKLGCDEQTTTTSLSINGNQIGTCSQIFQKNKNGGIISESGNCPSE